MGGAGSDQIEGLYGNDEIDAGAGVDHVFARDGVDLVYGPEGNDMLTGGAGDDVFAINAAEGSVTIQDFGPDDAADRIDVSSLCDLFATPEDLMAALSYNVARQASALMWMERHPFSRP